ncbi:MAG: VpsP family polysaccharide biosynthesis protein [Colwellia sp.]|nr:VpsP family polysaccharide biosynthesis protein [Colwellia sp.]
MSTFSNNSSNKETNQINSQIDSNHVSKSSRNELSRLKRLLMLIMSLLLLSLAWQSIKMGKANLSFYAANHYLETWLDINKLTDVEEYQKALRSINDANGFHPDNSHYLVTQGLVYEWAGTGNIFSDEKERKQQLLKAKAYYLDAVKLRPTWPVTWATLAILKWRLGEIDQQLIDYLFQADKFGQHTPEVNQAWLEVGFYLYQNKSTFTAKIVKGLRKHLVITFNDPRPYSRKLAVAIIKRHQAERLACSWLYNNEKFISLYKAKICKPLPTSNNQE